MLRISHFSIGAEGVSQTDRRLIHQVQPIVLLIFIAHIWKSKYMDAVCCLDSNYYAFIREVTLDEFNSAFGSTPLFRTKFSFTSYILWNPFHVFNWEKWIFFIKLKLLCDREVEYAQLDIARWCSPLYREFILI